MNKLITSPFFLVILAIVLTVGSIMTASMLWPEPPSPPIPSERDLKIVDGPGAAALWNIRSGQLDKLADELKVEREKLAQREEQIAQLQQRYDAEVRELQRLQAEIVRMQKDFSEDVLVVEASEVKSVRNQAEIYANMEPANAVKVFDKMEEKEVAKILYFMNTDTLSAIFQAWLQTDKGPEKVSKYNAILKNNKPPKKKDAGT